MLLNLEAGVALKLESLSQDISLGKIQKEKKENLESELKGPFPGEDWRKCWRKAEQSGRMYQAGF